MNMGNANIQLQMAVGEFNIKLIFLVFPFNKALLLS